MVEAHATVLNQTGTLMSNETFRPLGYLSVIKLSRSLTAIYPPCYLTTVSPLGDVVSNKVKEELHTSGLFGTPKTAYIKHWQAMLVGELHGCDGETGMGSSMVVTHPPGCMVCVGTRMAF